VLERGAHPGQRDAVAQQVAQVAQLTRRDVRLRQQVGAEQVRERARVDRVRLHPGGGDRFRAQRMGKMQLVAGVLEQIGQPFPSVGRLERDPGVIAQFVQQAEEGLGLVDDPAREQLIAVLIEDGDL
jgi:hypothetical protein